MKCNVGPKSKCPCGSGKFYKNCHDPKNDSSDQNLWKGPGYPQSIIIGDKEKFNGIKYEFEGENEFTLRNLSGEIIPIGKFSYVNEDVLDCSAIISELNILVNNDFITYSGAIRVKGNIKSIPLIIGISDISRVYEFNVNNSGRNIRFNKGNWFFFIGEDENPIDRIRKMAKWFHYFKSPGFLVKLDPFKGEYYFKLTAKIKSSNIFTFSLPFGNFELSCPNIITEKNITTCFMDIERENIFWDPILSQEEFNDVSRKDAITYMGKRENEEIIFTNFEKRLRKTFECPRKISINLFIPDENPILNEFSEIIENSLRTIAEGSRFNQGYDTKKIHEADFRDKILDILKINGHFAFAEPSRKEGFIDILIKHQNLEVIAEFKVWGRRKYNKVINQALTYGTAWTTEYVIVMINPNKGPITEKYMSNSKKSRGFEEFVFLDEDYKPVQKLVSMHYIANWQKRFNITHFIINLNFLK